MRTPRTCLILGSGMGGLALGALLARAGVEVTILEAHPELVGGWAQTLRCGDYKFCMGPRYLWNFGPGQIGRRFLDKCALTDQVPLVEFDRQGFDHIYVGDDAPIRVPNGWSAYEDLLKERFPAEASGIGKFFSLCRSVFTFFEIIDEQGLYLEPWPAIMWRCFRRHPGATARLLLNPHLTLHQVFERCRLSPRLRTILFGHNLIFLHPPESLSFYIYVGATLLYHRGCYFPTGDMEGFVGAVAETIEKHNGRILCNQRVTAVTAGTGGVEAVTTHTGENFTAEAVVVNFDPNTFLNMVDSPAVRASLHLPKYTYSESGCSLFVGVSDASVLKPSFGKWNVWYHAEEDPGPPPNIGPFGEFKYIYANSTTLVKGVNNDAPPGHATLTVFVPASYHAWKQLSPAAKEKLKDQGASTLVDILDKRFAPGLKDKVARTHVQTPEDKERVMQAPQGNIYGRNLGPREAWIKLPFKGLLPNLYFVGAYTSFAGIASVIHGACRLYQELTGDRV